MPIIGPAAVQGAENQTNGKMARITVDHQGLQLNYLNRQEWHTQTPDGRDQWNHIAVRPFTRFIITGGRIWRGLGGGIMQDGKFRRVNHPEVAWKSE